MKPYTTSNTLTSIRNSDYITDSKYPSEESAGPYQLIAATAISLDYTVATVNIGDFEKIPGVKMEKLQSP